MSKQNRLPQINIPVSRATKRTVYEAANAIKLQLEEAGYKVGLGQIILYGFLEWKDSSHGFLESMKRGRNKAFSAKVAQEMAKMLEEADVV